MANAEEKMPTATQDLEKHGSNGDNYPSDRRRSSVQGRFRSSIAVEHMPEGAVEGQVFSMNAVDPALDKKMRLVNQVACSRSTGMANTDSSTGH